ncbi:hypothetical protein B1756_14360 [Natrarchaeobaculum aegyptiacum]|uniref:Uncharacterized protein n=1 Tax=Natrarchaeobaculum aegyptiacum TaxID=745377 RepID=A0A2Z2HU54_9EURY|nr:hypothetical protein B1756_14360 [Natrarchaeobaculum aegyptiacum]
MERLYRNITGESAEFSTFDEAEEAFLDVDWDDNILLEFVDQVKQIVEKGENRISETYFDIIEPDSISTAFLERELSDPAYDPDAEGEEKDGFEYQVADNGNIRGRYVYTDVTTNLTFNGEIQPTMSDGFIQFEIDPDKRLLIIKSTSVIDVQKARKYFNNKTSIDFAPAADYTTHTDGAVDRINNFLAEFHDGIPSDDQDVPGLLQVDTIKLEDTSVDSSDEEDEDEDDNGQQLENIQFEGHDIKNDDEVQSYLGDDSPWVIKKLEAEIYYEGDNFKVTIGTTSMMSYGKVSDSTDWQATSELSSMVREWFLEHLRVRDL